MLPIRVILHPTDFSSHSAPAFELACALARDHNARMIVLHVREVPVVSYGDLGAIPIEIETPEVIRAKLDALISLRCKGGSVPIAPWVRIGDPADEILTAARDSGCDMIVLSTHGRTGLSRLLMGSVAEKVVRKATCPVLTVKSPMKERLVCETVGAEPVMA